MENKFKHETIIGSTKNGIFLGTDQTTIDNVILVDFNAREKFTNKLIVGKAGNGKAYYCAEIKK